MLNERRGGDVRRKEKRLRAGGDGGQGGSFKERSSWCGGTKDGKAQKKRGEKSAREN